MEKQPAGITVARRQLRPRLQKVNGMAGGIAKPIKAIPEYKLEIEGTKEQLDEVWKTLMREGCPVAIFQEGNKLEYHAYRPEHLRNALKALDQIELDKVVMDCHLFVEGATVLDEAWQILVRARPLLLYYGEQHGKGGLIFAAHYPEQIPMAMELLKGLIDEKD